MKIQFLLAMVFNFGVFAAQASDRVGNGGDVLLCFKDLKTSYRMLDLFQAKHQFGLTVDLGPATLSFEEKVSYALDRLGRSQPQRAEKYRQWSRQFFAEAELLPGITLVDIPDTGAQVIPKDCTLAQIAVQRTEQEMIPGDKRYTIDQDLWEKLDDDNKAALVLHELVYRETLQFTCPLSTVFVRYMTAHLMSQEIASVNMQSFMTLARRDYFERGNEKILISWGTCNWQQPVGYFSPAKNKSISTTILGETIRNKTVPKGLMCDRIRLSNGPHGVRGIFFEDCQGPDVVVLVSHEGDFGAATIASDNFSMVRGPHDSFVLSTGRLTSEFNHKGFVCPAGRVLLKLEDGTLDCRP